MHTVTGAATDAALVLAAREALNTFEMLEAREDLAPDDDEPVWLLWHHDSYHPAFRSWAKAMDNLELLLGDAFPGRHRPGEWISVCVRILSGELR